jgi:AcrR family transcriptional regulator
MSFENKTLNRRAHLSPGVDRPGRQARGLETRRRIAAAAISVLAEKGLAGVTHRLVASQAGVSLAATTYHFASKFDIIAVASRTILDGYCEAFTRSAARFRVHPEAAPSFPEFFLRLLRNAVGRDRPRTLAWAEITLDAVRHQESLALAREWNEQIASIWSDIAQAVGETHPQRSARSGIDAHMGLLLMTSALELTETALDAVLVSTGDPLEYWTQESEGVQPAGPVQQGKAKAEATRAQLLRIAIDLLVSDGPAAIGYRAIAERAGLSTAAPTYYFPSIAELLTAAQATLFENSRNRNRAIMTAGTYDPLDTTHFVDLVTTVFIREATEFASENLANFAIWIEAARRPELRPMIWTAIRDQYHVWMRVFQLLSPERKPRQLDGILVEALFLGKLLRILSTGSETETLARARQELQDDLTALLRGNFWL